MQYFQKSTFPRSFRNWLPLRLPVGSQWLPSLARTFHHGFNVNILSQVVWDEKRRLERVG